MAEEETLCSISWYYFIFSYSSRSFSLHSTISFQWGNISPEESKVHSKDSTSPLSWSRFTQEGYWNVLSKSSVSFFHISSNIHVAFLSRRCCSEDALQRQFFSCLRPSVRWSGENVCFSSRAVETIMHLCIDWLSDIFLSARQTFVFSSVNRNQTRMRLVTFICCPPRSSFYLQNSQTNHFKDHFFTNQNGKRWEMRSCALIIHEQVPIIRAPGKKSLAQLIIDSISIFFPPFFLSFLHHNPLFFLLPYFFLAFCQSWLSFRWRTVSNHKYIYINFCPRSSPLLFLSAKAEPRSPRFLSSYSRCHVGLLFSSC